MVRRQLCWSTSDWRSDICSRVALPEMVNYFLTLIFFQNSLKITIIMFVAYLQPLTRKLEVEVLMANHYVRFAKRDLLMEKTKNLLMHIGTVRWWV